jgi:phenylalanyl-tRNA synthetase beta chain
MLVSYNWLKQFTNIEHISPQEIAEKLTLHSVEVEDIIELGANLEHVVVAKVTEVKKHENAESLNVCQVFDGIETVQIVCGGSNVTEGMLCALGKVGAKVRWHGEGDLIELTKAKIRGEASYGMICAADEIGLGSMFPKADEKEILDLTHYFPERPAGVEGSHGGSKERDNSTSLRSTQENIVGTPLKEALGLDDVLIDVENKTMTHRPDLWGHYGMAREVSAILGVPLTAYNTAPIIDEDCEQAFTVNIKTDHCHRYMAVALNGVAIAPSPQWMQDRIRAVGMTPKNNIVDITNYVMIELGQPMHAFDGSQIGTDITIRQATAEESFTALGGKEYVLTTEDMVITSGGKVVALAGVKGDEFSGVTDSTTSILLEAATFDPTSVRRAATRHGLRTDASARFEKSLDTNLAEIALRRAVALVLELCPDATVVSTVANVTTKPTTSITIELDMQYLWSRVGVKCAISDVQKTLESLGFGVTANKDNLSVVVPTWRATKDVSIQEDLIEEVARMYGYNNIPVSLPVASIAPPPTDDLREIEKKLTSILAQELGYAEIYNYSFVDPEYITRIGLPLDGYLELDNPVAKDRPYLRKHLFPNMLLNVEENLHRFDTVSIFEIGRVYHDSPLGEISSDMMDMQRTKCVVMFASKQVDIPYFELRHVLDTIVSRLGIAVTLTPITTLSSPWDAIVHPGRVADIMVGDTHIGSISELHPTVQKKLGIAHRTASLELDVAKLARIDGSRVNYRPIPLYPAVDRDISFLIDATTTHADIVTLLSEVDPHIVSVTLLDVYQGAHVSEEKKSMAYRIRYQSQEKTLETKEVHVLHDTVTILLKEKFNAELR